MKKILNKILYIFIFISVFLPSFVSADLVPCKQTLNSKGTWDNTCDFAALVQLASNIIDFILKMAGSISAIMFAYAGFLYLSAQGDSGKITTAHKIFKNVALGIFFVVGAWLIVKAILVGLGAESYGLLGS
ncbi:MAG: hypothetical protein ABIG87_01315 [Patescibacteria group bacterium]